VGCGFDERLADPQSPKIGLDEQAVELAADHRRKARDPAIKFGNDHLAVRDLGWRKMDRIGMRKQILAIFGQLQRGATLQLLKVVMLLGRGQPKDEEISAL